MDTISIFRDLAIIIISCKIMGIVARQLKAPQVVGEIVAGLLIGPSVLGWVGQSDFLVGMAEIGVVLLMFTAGLETNLRDLIKTGPVALLIAIAGVATPLLGGWLLYSCFYGFSPIGSPEFLTAVFTGVIMTATSVSITVQALREMGRLKGLVGTTILNAAIIDDVIGIIVLTFVIGMKDPDSDPLKVVISTVLFFVFCFVFGFITYLIFKKLDDVAPHRRRIPIFSLAVCFAFAYIAEEFFGIADITGAYVAGIVLCSIHDADYVAQKMDISSYMLFGPVFFAGIGLKTELSGIDGNMILFIIGFVLVALVTKIIGCGLMAKACHFEKRDCLKIGVGMMTRGEVALIVSQQGLQAGMMEAKYFAAVIMLIIISSIATPIILKLLYKGEPAMPKYSE